MDKLLEFQKRVGVILKDQVNPFFKSRYADINALLEVIKPILNELDLVIVQPLKIIDGKSVLTTKIIDGDKILLESEIVLPENNDPQKIGSAITYYRRYSLQSILLLQAQDDDGNLVKGDKPPFPETKHEPEQGTKYDTAYSYQPVNHQQKVIGGTCPSCGGKYISGKTGTIFCENKCWLNK